jgi:hypothetical protein
MRKNNERYSERESKRRFDAALRGSRNVDPDAKPVPMKRGRPAKGNDPVPAADAAALVAWGKRNIQKD